MNDKSIVVASGHDHTQSTTAASSSATEILFQQIFNVTPVTPTESDGAGNVAAAEISFKQRAEYMTRRGVKVVPALPGEKRSHLKRWPQLATTSPEQIEQWDKENPDFNCVSVPTPDTVWIGDIDDLGVLERLPHQLPPTLKISTPSDGLHVYFKQTLESEAMGNRNVKEGEECVFEAKVNILSAASPGSITAKGAYTVIDDSPIAPAPQWLIDWIIENSKAKRTHSGSSKSRPLHPSFGPDHFYDHYERQGAFSILRTEEKDGFDVDIPSIGCIIKGYFHDQSTLTGFIRSNDGFGYCCFAAGCDGPSLYDVMDKLEEEGYERYPYYIYADEDDSLIFNDPTTPVEYDDPNEVEASPSTESQSTGEASAPATGYNFRATDTGNAERLVRRFGNLIRYVRDAEEWRVWNGKCWATDKTGRVERSAKKIAQEIFEEAELLEDDDKRKALWAWGRITEGRERRNAMIDLASKEHAVVTLIENYDQDPWLFNVQNGTIDLRTGELKQHDPADMMTKISPVTYDPEGKCPLWDKFLARVQNNDQEMVDFLSRAGGYTLTGDTSIQALFFLHGDGCNGKGVFTSMIRLLMGNYGDNASFDTFVVQKNDGKIRNDLAKLVGARYVTASESQEGHRLDESLIKSLTGQDPITTRFLHKEFFTYFPQFKIWMSSNYKPSIRGLDWGIWRRVKMIPFEVVIPDEERDEQLIDKLKAELPGILNWALKGLADFRNHGMMYPDKVNAATQQYRDSQDIIGQFLTARCVINPMASIKSSTLYDAYKTWAENAKEYILKERQFTDAMKKHGYEPEHKNNGNHYVGLAPLAAEPRTAMDDSVYQ
jgi:putative DNA primase/helicase